MSKRIVRLATAAAVAAAVVGAGGTALAVTGSSDAGHSSTAKGKNHGLRIAARHLEHAQIVTKGKDGTVTRQLVRGTVTAVSGSAITVKAADGTSLAFTVTKDTAVRTRSDGKAAASTISAVHTGDQAFVTGVGATHPVAKRVLDVTKK